MTTERRSGTLSVIVPVLNEEGNIPELVRRLKAVRDGGLPFDVIVVDDGSTDRTPQDPARVARRGPRSPSVYVYSLDPSPYSNLRCSVHDRSIAREVPENWLTSTRRRSIIGVAMNPTDSPLDGSVDL
jgi:hypothetical protein